MTKKKLSFISRKYPASDNKVNQETIDRQYEDFLFDEPTDIWEDEKEKAFAILSEMLREILSWLCEGSIDSKCYKDKVFRKTLAMVWCMRPDILENNSLRSLAKRGGVNLTHASISKNVSMFTNAFGRFHNGTKSDEAKAKYSKITKMYHKKQKGILDK